MEQARLFWAINLPAEVKTKLALFQSRLRELPVDVKWVEQQNLHLTVKFMSGVDREKINGLVQAVEHAVAGKGAISLKLEGAGFFPDSRRPRVIWVGVQGEVNKLRRLQQMVETNVTMLGFPPENKHFSPHLTVGRLRSPSGTEELVYGLKAVAGEFACFGKVDVKTVDLMESRLTRMGPVYSVAAVVKLTGECCR